MFVALYFGQVSLRRVVGNRVEAAISDVLVKLLSVEALFHFPFLNILKSLGGSFEVIRVIDSLILVIISFFVSDNLLPELVWLVLDSI
jgi:hypothetical protein